MTTKPTKRRFSKNHFFEYIEYQPHAGQQLVHDSKARRRIVACGVRWGKTMCAAMEGLAAAMEPREHSIGWVVAPTYDLADRVYQQIVSTVAEKLRFHIISAKGSERRLILRNFGGGTSEIRAKSADNPVSLLGEGLDWVIVDEAARLKPMIWESHLSQRLLDKKGWGLLISTPRGRGYFYDLYRRGQRADEEGHQSWNLPSWTNPLLDAKSIEAERSRIPESAFLQEYGAQFVEGSGQVFRHVRELAVGEWQSPIPGMRYFAGLDLAKTEDFTVLVIANAKREIVFVDRFHRMDWNLQVNRVRASLDRYFRARVLCDTTGVGDPIYESLRHMGCYAQAYPFTQKSKSDLINNLSIMMEQRSIVLPKVELCPDLIDELEGFEYSITDSGGIRSGAASGMHDDTVMALALAMWNVRHQPPPFKIYHANTMADLKRLSVRLSLGGNLPRQG